MELRHYYKIRRDRNQRIKKKEENKKKNVKQDSKGVLAKKKQTLIAKSKNMEKRNRKLKFKLYSNEMELEEYIINVVSKSIS